MSETIADRIRIRLAAIGKSASAASIEAGMGRSAVQDILSGNSGNPRIKTLQRLAGPLQTSVDYLAEGNADGFEDALRNNPHASLVETILGLEAEVYRMDPVEIDVPDGLHVAYHDERRPDLSVSLYRLLDESMSKFGLVAGDTITAVDAWGAPLQDGSFVVVYRQLGESPAAEHSLRRVLVDADGISLVCGHPSREVAPIKIDASAPESDSGDDEKYGVVGGGVILILGIAASVSRQLAIPE